MNPVLPGSRSRQECLASSPRQERAPTSHSERCVPGLPVISFERQRMPPPWSAPAASTDQQVPRTLVFLARYLGEWESSANLSSAASDRPVGPASPAMSRQLPKPVTGPARPVAVITTSWWVIVIAERPV